MPPLRLGVLGTGGIASEFAELGPLRSIEITAVASRDAARARQFADQHGIGQAFGSYAELVADPATDAVYIALPHRQHAEWAIAAARAGKHVLCEKPLTVTAADAERVIGEARKAGVLVMEAYAYQFHAQTTELSTLIAERRIGEIRASSVTFSFAADADSRTRLTAHELAGGAILDVGCYCVSMSRRIAGSARGTTALEPTDVVGAAILDPVERVDLEAAGILTFSGGPIAQVACAITLDQANEIRLSGTHGEILITKPCWIPECRNTETMIEIRDHEGTETRVIPAEEHIFARELEMFAWLVSAPREEWELSWAESLANMRTLDRWRAAVGVRYDFEATGEVN